jgi:hypothetical protein
MSDPRSSFSERFEYRAPDAEITVREDAPEEIRAGVVILGYATGMGREACAAPYVKCC